jgi:Mrp family chromosome partitioning ATPase
VLHSRFPPGEIQKVIASDDFSKFIRQARGLYDFIIVEAPPVMLFADALYLGKCADFILHVVQWASTPRRTVIAGLERMRNIGIRVDGLVLSGINEKEYRRQTGARPHFSPWAGHKRVAQSSL